MRRPFVMRLFAAVVAASSLVPTLSAQLQTGTSPSTRQLIVTLKPGSGALSPKSLVASVGTQSPLPGALAVGNPLRAHYLLSFRAQGEFLAALEANPSDPRAQLERTVVLTYPVGTNLNSVKSALAADTTNVEAVAENAEAQFLLVPNDPQYSDISSPPYQWGLQEMNFESAWELTTGHGYVGVPDSGLNVEIPACLLSGTETGHEDLRPFRQVGSTYVYEHGNYRPSLSRDFGQDDLAAPDLCVNELQVEPIYDQSGQWLGTYGTPDYAGHGTHVSGIIAATTNNAVGVAGSAWRNSLLLAKSTHLLDCSQNSQCISLGVDTVQSAAVDDVAEAVTWLADQGVQVINMSFSASASFLNNALNAAANRDATLVAASGNGAGGSIPFPANDDARVIAVGGIEYPNAFWYDEDPVTGAIAGSNWGPQQDLVAPAQKVVSTLYANMAWNPISDCQDSNTPELAYGRCTGTSMAAPHVAGLAGLLRSIDPLVSRQNIQDVMQVTASNGGVWDDHFGWGIPDARAAAEALLGSAKGQLLRNRLTPLFALYSSVAADHFFTTVPQMVAAAICSNNAYRTNNTSVAASVINGYAQFPGTAACTATSGEQTPRAALYLYSTDKNAVAGGPALLPLFRLGRKFVQGGNPDHFDHVYASSEAELTTLRNSGYELEGVEGYVNAPPASGDPCSAASAPAGTVPIARRYNPTRGDHAIFPLSELSSWTAAGYTQITNDRACIGYAAPNADSDGDAVIDAFEELLGTDALAADSDCDGASDGAEVLGYPRSEPLSAGGCVIFKDDFELGNLTRWTSITVNNALVGASSLAPIRGSFSLHASDNPMSGNPTLPYGFVTDDSPNAEGRYRVRFSFRPGAVAMLDGNTHVIFNAEKAGSSRLRMQFRKSGGQYQLRMNAWHDDGTLVSSPWRTISGTTTIEMDWKAAASASVADGFAKLWLSGVLLDVLAGLPNSNQRIDSASLGMVSGVDAGTTGSHVFDDFESRRATYIGPAQ